MIHEDKFGSRKLYQNGTLMGFGCIQISQKTIENANIFSIFSRNSGKKKRISILFEVKIAIFSPI